MDVCWLPQSTSWTRAKKVRLAEAGRCRGLGRAVVWDGGRWGREGPWADWPREGAGIGLWHLGRILAPGPRWSYMGPSDLQ